MALIFKFKHRLRTNTQKLVKGRDGMIKDLVNKNDDGHLKIQKDRLVDEFTAALTAFPASQKKTMDIEKSQYRQARSHNVSISKPPGSQNKSAPFFDNFSPPSNKTTYGSIQMQEEIDLHALEEQERRIRELEVNENNDGIDGIPTQINAKYRTNQMLIIMGIFLFSMVDVRKTLRA